MDELASRLYKSIADKDELRPMERWHASSIAECPRAQYFRRLEIAPLSKPGAGKMLRWQAGHLIEEVIRPHLLGIYPDLKSNERIDSDSLDLTGEYDNYSEEKQTIFEVKSVHDFAFAYRKKGDARFDLKDYQPYINHELQNHCYVKLLREQGKPVSSITYVYITLDGRIATYETAVDPDILSEVDRRLEVLNSAWADQNPPECICKEGHLLWGSTMQYCPYRDKSICCSLNLINGSIDPDWSEA